MPYFYYYIIILYLYNNVVLSSSLSSSQSTSKVTIFHVIDSSHISLWLNWWLIAIELDIIPIEWDYYLACFGNINDIVKQYHSPGCTKSYLSSLHKTHIYYAKWISINDAFKTKRNLLCIDIDTVMIRNPSYILDINHDIISSRDHGPGNLEYSNNWGNARVCTGFIYLRYSQYTEEFINNVLQRCKVYGHDQIQFNKLSSRSSLIWYDSPLHMNNDSIDHDGYIPWFSQHDPNFIVIKDNDLLNNWIIHNDTINYMINNNNNTIINKYNNTIITKIINQSSLNPYTFQKKLQVKLLSKFQILRYCSNPQHKGKNWVYHLSINNNIYKNDISDLTLLHCFTFNGNINEQGNDKSTTKLWVLIALNLWVLNNTYNIPFFDSNFLLPQSNNTKTFIHHMINKKNLYNLKNIWLQGNFKTHKTLYQLDNSSIKLKKVSSRKKKKNNKKKSNGFGRKNQQA